MFVNGKSSFLHKIYKTQSKGETGLESFSERASVYLDKFTKTDIHQAFFLLFGLVDCMGDKGEKHPFH